MNCCNAFGTCVQGPNCPVRIKPISTKWANTVPPEAGNVRLPPVDDTDGVPLSHAETMELVRLMIYLLLGVIVFFGALGLAMSYSTERWADVLWAYLAALS